MSTYLCIFIDTTGSMGSWINTLNIMIPQFIRISAITGAFKQICVISYKDYDVMDVITSTGWCDPNDSNLTSFSSKLKATGGGGNPEAVKTGLYYLLDNLPVDLDKTEDKIYLLHLTDAPAHDMLSKKGDYESKKELNKLGTNKFNWINLTGEILKQPIIYSCLSSCKYNLYASLSTSTKGFYKIINNVSNLQNEILNIFNGWFGVDEETIQCSVLASELDYTKINCETKLLHNYSIVTKYMSIKQPKLTYLFATILTRLDTDEKFRNYIFNILEKIIDEDVLTLTTNKIFGKLWRKVCCYRKDPRRDTLISLIESKKKLLSQTSRTVFDSWLKESYNMIEEIRAELEELVQDEKINLNGCIEFIRDIGDVSEPADMVGMLRVLDATSQSYIKNIYARLAINPSKQYDIKSNNALPLNISPEKLFSLIIHLVAPGTRFGGRRNQAILAILALGTVLNTQAQEFLRKHKGKWLNWIYDEENKPEIPENFQVKFLYLCKKLGSEFLTEEEISKINRLTTLTLCNRIPEMNIEVSSEILTGMDGVREDIHKLCTKCNLTRPISLILDDEKTCGYCFHNVKPHVEPLPNATYLVKCTKCSSFYSRDKGLPIQAKSQCHECYNGLESRGVKCNICENKFVCRLKNGLPNGCCRQCKLCKPKLKPIYKTHNLTVAQLLSDTNDGSELINSMIGFDWIKDVKNLIQMDLALKEITKPDLNDIKNKTIIWNSKVICNWPEIVDKIDNSIQSHFIERITCGLCCETKPNSELGKACGRKGCEQILCNDCGKQWYASNKIGEIVNLRHCQCMFCSRIPAPKITRRWWIPEAINLFARPDTIPELNPVFYYAWCVDCRLIKQCGERACGDGTAPRIENFSCEECVATREIARMNISNSTSEDVDTKHCPKCNVATFRYSGCNHMTCPCGTHWCYECGDEFDYDIIYNHMRKEHGRIYSYETPDYDDEDYY